MHVQIRASALTRVKNTRYNYLVQIEYLSLCHQKIINYLRSGLLLEL